MVATTILRRPFRVRFLVAIAIGALITYRLCLSPTTHSWLLLPDGDGDHATAFGANSTLGFGRIYVVSKEDSPRRHGLLQAANITELDLTIPVQPEWTDADLDVPFKIGKGSLLAWLGHLHALRLYVPPLQEKGRREDKE